MRSSGIVRVWHAADGWGVIDCQDTPGGCWAHFSSVLAPGLLAGQSVLLHHEPAEQDGYSFRALAVWPADQVPHRAEGDTSGDSDAYRSTLTISWDASEDPM
jgi:cold shock protein